jgi:hypothetical protein
MCEYALDGLSISPRELVESLMLMLDDLVKIHMAAPRFAIQPVKSYG